MGWDTIAIIVGAVQLVAREQVESGVVLRLTVPGVQIASGLFFFFFC